MAVICYCDTQIAGHVNCDAWPIKGNGQMIYYSIFMTTTNIQEIKNKLNLQLINYLTKIPSDNRFCHLVDLDNINNSTQGNNEEILKIQKCQTTNTKLLFDY
jgi:hypothetical protein